MTSDFYTLHGSFNRPLPLGNVRCIPRVTRLFLTQWNRVRDRLHTPLLSHLTELHLSGGLIDCVDGLLPATLRSLHIDYSGLPITASTLPPKLTSLTLYCEDYYRPLPSLETLSPSQLPASLTELTLGGRALLPGVWPSGLHTLKLRDWSQPLQPHSLPPSLRRLTFIHGCTHPIPSDTVPDTVEELDLSNTNWDQPLHGVFHLDRSRLRVLELPAPFNQPFTARCLPPSLVRLVFPSLSRWNHELDRVHLPNLQLLTLGEGFTRRLTASTLSGCPALQILDMRWCRHFRHPLTADSLPASVTHLDLPGNYDEPLPPASLPASVQRLRVGNSLKSLCRS